MKALTRIRNWLVRHRLLIVPVDWEQIFDELSQARQNGKSEIVFAEYHASWMACLDALVDQARPHWLQGPKKPWEDRRGRFHPSRVKR